MWTGVGVVLCVCFPRGWGSVRLPKGESAGGCVLEDAASPSSQASLPQSPGRGWGTHAQ